MANIRKRSNTWIADFKDRNGNRLCRTTKVRIIPKCNPYGKTFKQLEEETRREAQMRAEALEEYSKWGEKVSPEKLDILIRAELIKMPQHLESVEAFLDRFLQSRKRNSSLSFSSILRTQKAFERFLEFLGDKKSNPLASVTKAVCDDFVSSELHRVSSRTVDRYRESLSCAFNRAVDEDIITKNPFKHVKIPKCGKDSSPRRAFTQDEIRKLISALPEDWSDMVIACICLGGQRLGDIASLKWNQVDWPGGTISLTTQKTGRVMRDIPLIPALEKLLRKRHQGMINEYIFPVQGEMYVQGKGSSLSGEFVSLLRAHGFVERKVVQKQGDRRTFSPLSFHSLRSSVVTSLHNQGVPPEMCREIVGHDSEEIQRIYYRPNTEEKRDHMKKLGIVLGDDTMTKNSEAI
ncbi:tyrosine-type recombinase/integrase [Akkermansia sp. B2-R-115]|jgi:integrase|uniref:tyrosine-type recombinase/integrase n=1 Tax=Akkermansia massiliensis TaxID=2927224 RepID=UPI00202E895F|nr:tyrosine-type recombinase/integrase [Akkermansia sp. B2-R-115]MCM0685303.1 tyrosine-type recombinase/integrase [Akkermansia sp. B2-R-115]